MFTWSAKMIDREVEKAKEVLSSGGIILYPTDTIWGLGCDATLPDAVRRIYEIKKRSDSKSMLLLVSGVEMLEHYLEKVPPMAVDLINSSTSPTTIIYPGARNLAPNLLAEDGSVGIRITSDPFCQNLISLFGRPIVSTSANISGEAAPGIFKDITESIKEKVDHVVRLRQQEKKAASSSRILKIEKEGKLTVIRP